MSEGNFLSSGTGTDCHIHLRYIFDYYATLFAPGKDENVKLYKMVAKGVSSESQRQWSWRYILSVYNGTLRPSRFLRNAIERHYQTLCGKPHGVYVLPCPTCGEVHPCDCGSQRVTRLPGSGPRRARRIAISVTNSHSAAMSIAANIEPRVVAEIVDYLTQQMEYYEYQV
jgi:hypothetical protein